MIQIDYRIQPDDLREELNLFWELSAEKIKNFHKNYNASKGSPVFTVNGKYIGRGWTEWTKGFQLGSSVLQYDATGNFGFLDQAKYAIVSEMASHVSHTGVHDHGFNNLSTYGNLYRLMKEEKIPLNYWEKNFYELALKVSGAVQARRWTTIQDGGFIYSFNGPHSLFVDTIRSCRSLVVAHLLGHVLQEDNDVRISLLDRAVNHILATAKYCVFYGEGRDGYDVWGRTAHESIFNINDGNFRCVNSQQGYSAFSTWTRGLSWAMLGFAEQLEAFSTFAEDAFSHEGGKTRIMQVMLKAARATCDFYIENVPADGVPYWDTGAPGLVHLGDYKSMPADPYNEWEPVDSSAAVVAAQGLLRLGNYLRLNGEGDEANKYWQAGLTIMNTLLDYPYLNTDPDHQGLLLHSVYHHPNRWDFVPSGRKVPCGESSMWGDYHAREAALYLKRILSGNDYFTYY